MVFRFTSGDSPDPLSFIDGRLKSTSCESSHVALDSGTCSNLSTASAARVIDEIGAIATAFGGAVATQAKRSRYLTVKHDGSAYRSFEAKRFVSNKKLCFIHYTVSVLCVTENCRKMYQHALHTKRKFWKRGGTRKRRCMNTRRIFFKADIIPSTKT